MTGQYVSTVVPDGCARYAVRMGAQLVAVVDMPLLGASESAAAGAVRRWLTDEQQPPGVVIWPA